MENRMGAALLRAARWMIPVVLLVAVLDQLSKWAIQDALGVGERMPIIDGFFDLTLTYNRGAAFGFLGNIEDDTLRHLLLGLSTAGALGVVLYFLLHDYVDDVFAQIALALIIGGAAGNIIDRVTIGAVIDFLDVYIGQYHWPAFNIADSAICIGVFVLVFRRPSRVPAAYPANNTLQEPQGPPA
jgi:signal peptidase II